jgi:uncharacterized membrane-anchored protein YhcB (DUF1043 family)
MLNLDELKKQLENYKMDWQKTAENRERLVQMLNQQEIRLQQLNGAIAALEKLLKDMETPANPTEEENAGNENTAEPTEG